MMALNDFPISARAAAVDLDRARRWYDEKLGLVPEREDRGGVWYRFAGETWIYLYATPSAGTAQNTIAGRELSVAIRQFKDAELVRYARGQISVADVDGLKARSCGCSNVIPAEARRLDEILERADNDAK